jgi:hypothetical protein
MKHLLVAITIVAFLSFPAVGRADTILVANLTNSQENPPTVPTLDGVSTPRPVSFGNATFTLNDAMTQMIFTATVFNIDFGRVPPQGTPVVNPPNANPNPQTANILNDDLLVAHIHRGPVGTNGPVIWGFIGAPFNDNSPNDVVVTPFAFGIGGTVSGKWDLTEGNNTTLAAEIPNILSGNTYINFHTVQFGGGEIRGQIIPTIPEPASLSLLVIGGAILVGKRVRGRRKV